MIKIRILIALLFFCGTAFSQIYTPTVPTVFGQNFNRIKPIIVQHLPEKTGLTLNTSDSTAQLFFNKSDSQFYTYNKFTGFAILGSGGGSGTLLNVVVDSPLLAYQPVIDSVYLKVDTTHANGTALVTQWWLSQNAGSGTVTTVGATYPVTVSGTPSINPTIGVDTNKYAHALATYTDVQKMTNLATGDQIANGKRTHNWNNYSFEINNATRINFLQDTFFIRRRDKGSYFIGTLTDSVNNVFDGFSMQMNRSDSATGGQYDRAFNGSYDAITANRRLFVKEFSQSSFAGYVIERRPEIVKNDSVILSIDSNTTPLTSGRWFIIFNPVPYSFGMPLPVSAITLYDKYLGTTTSLKTRDTTLVVVNLDANPASRKSRWTIKFTYAPVPDKFIWSDADSAIGIIPNTLLAMDKDTVKRIPFPTINGSGPDGSFNYTVASGGLSASNFVINEVPSGTVNSSNVTFAIANTPVSGTVQVWVSGVKQKPTTHYSVSGTTITFVTAPTTGSDLLVNYIK